MRGDEHHVAAQREEQQPARVPIALVGQPRLHRARAHVGPGRRRRCIRGDGQIEHSALGVVVGHDGRHVGGAAEGVRLRQERREV